MEADGTFEVLPKKKLHFLMSNDARLEKFLGGIEDMPRIPDESSRWPTRTVAVKEAKKTWYPSCSDGWYKQQSDEM